MERDGQSISEEEAKKRDLQWTIRDNEFVLMPRASKGPEHFPQRRFTLDPTKTPKTIDLAIDVPLSHPRKPRPFSGSMKSMATA
jgi:uncharacterized protein (TIGR03067 family)